MKVGFGLVTCQRHPADARSDADLYEDAVELAVETERLGFDSVWVSEHHFVDDGYMPSLLPVCAAMAARTSRIEIGTGVLLAPMHDPLRLAEDAATVDLLSRGRLLLGLGMGWREEELEAFGVTKRAAELRESVRVLREAWGDGLVAGPDVSVTPKPARAGGPPIWIGASVEPAVRRAARIADGFLATRSSPEILARQVGWLRDELEQAGRDPAAVAVGTLVSLFAWPDGDGWERVREHVHYVRWKYEDMADARSRTGGSPFPPPLDAARDAELRATTLVGPPDELAERLAAFADVAGTSDLHLVARAYWPGLEPAVQRESLAVLAEEVLPRLR